MSTTLLLQDIPTNDCRILTLCDASSYNPDLTVSNALLEITPPGFSCSVFFEVKPKFQIVLNSSNLKIVPAKTQSQLVCLPDGIYNIKYSIAPNDKQYVEYDFLRNVSQMNNWYKAISKLYHRRNAISKKDFEEKRHELIWIKELIDVAKYKAEECGEAQEAIELYNEANRLLVDFNNCPSC